MLQEAIHWLEMIATVTDGLLLLRVLSLRLNRVYLFVTLFCAVTLLIDVASWVLGWDSPETVRVSVYTQYLFALVFPLVAWDIFEEVKPQTAKLRRARAPRLFSGVLLSLICGLVGSATLEDKDFSGASTSVVFVGLIMWVGSCTTSLLFVWFVYKHLRSQPGEVPRNSATWSQYYMATLALFLLECAFSFFDPNATAKDIIRIVFLILGVAVTLWCVIRLRALPQDTAPAVEGATS
jgi:hypothetical protein